MGPKAKAAVWIVVAVLVLAAIVWYVASINTAQPLGGPGPTAVNQSQPGVPVFAPKGELVAGFPPSLILDPSVAVAGSYSINYSTTTNQYTASWNSSSSMLTLYNAYKQYFAANGWTIINDQTKFSTGRGFYARNASSDVSVAIIAQGKGSQVSVTYLAK